VRQPGALELGDGLLNDGVPAVVGLSHRQGSVGNERVVVPGREQRQLRAWGRADPAHHQADLPGVLAITREDGKRCLEAVSAPDTSGVHSQHGIGCHAPSGIYSIAARIGLSCRP